MMTSIAFVLGLVPLVFAHGAAQISRRDDLGVDRQRRGAAWMLRDDDLGTALVEVSNDGIAVEGLVGDEAVKGETVDERSNAYRIEMMAGQKNLGEYYSEPLVFSPNDATVFIIDAF